MNLSVYVESFQIRLECVESTLEDVWKVSNLRAIDISDVCVSQNMVWSSTIGEGHHAMCNAC